MYYDVHCTCFLVPACALYKLLSAALTNALSLHIASRSTRRDMAM